MDQNCAMGNNVVAKAVLRSISFMSGSQSARILFVRRTKYWGPIDRPVGYKAGGEAAEKQDRGRGFR